jgi:hypothetical protein
MADRPSRLAAIPEADIVIVLTGLSLGPLPAYRIGPSKSLDGQLRVNRVPHIYLIDTTALAYLDEICALDDESGSGG